MDTDGDWQSGKSLVETNRIMLENEIATDVTFVFPEGKQKVKAHKFILVSRSHVFYVMFTSSLHECGKDIEITDIEPAIFKEFLKFLYHDDVMISAENALHLLYVAQKYEVEVLKARCLDFLQNNLDVHTVGLILDQAVFYNEVKLYRKCMDFLSNNSIRSIKKLNEYHISKETLELIVECETLWVGEICIFTACNAWAGAECEKKALAVNAENKRKVLGSILKKIHFCSMTNEEIATQVSPTGLLAMQEELEIFRFIGTPVETNPPFSSKERMPLHAMLPHEVTKDAGRNMRLLFNIAHDSFHIYITCCREFKLLGFFFTKKGTFNICLNDDICDEFCVYETDVNMYLAKPVPCDRNNALDIREMNVDQKSHIRNETFSFSCKTRVNRIDNVVVTCSVTRYDLVPPPFNALILAL